jgi:hypothetical protein
MFLPQGDPAPQPRPTCNRFTLVYQVYQMRDACFFGIRSRTIWLNLAIWFYQSLVSCASMAAAPFPAIHGCGLRRADQPTGGDGYVHTTENNLPKL